MQFVRRLRSGFAFRRSRRAELAALSAALDNDAFDPERIRAGVTAIARAIEQIWARGRSGGLTDRPDHRLLTSWAGDIERQLGQGLRLARDPSLEIIGLVNREDEAEDRVVARVRLVVRRDTRSMTMEGDGSFMATRRVHIDQRWTLMPSAGQWYLRSTAGTPRTRAAFSRALVDSPVDDDARLHEAALRELAAADQTPNPAELLNTADGAANQLVELAVLDQRFSPSLIEVTLRHLIDCWEIASDGSDKPLHLLCAAGGADSLLHPAGGSMKRTIHDAALKTWTVSELAVSSKHPTVTLLLTIGGTWRHEGQGSHGPLAGPFSTIHLRWTLELHDGRDHQPQWKLAKSAPPPKR